MKNIYKKYTLLLALLFSVAFTQTTEFSLQQLNAEIVNDPQSIGYKVDATTWKGDAEIADLINNKNITLQHTDIASQDIINLTRYQAYNQLQADEQEWLVWITSQERVFVSLDVLNKFTNPSNSFWSNNTETEMNAKMISLIEYAGSRAEQLFGEGFLVSLGQVGAAANQ